MGTIGLLANPASGKDVRRLVARASVFDNQEKRAIVRRVIVGAHAAGARDFVFHNDAHGIIENALNEVGDVNARPVDSTTMGTALDTISAARAMKDAGCDIVVTLGGDGTNRAFCLGWPDAPLLPISTGTNNVFPVLTEATTAGAAAGLVATGQVPADLVLDQQKAIHVAIEDERDDFALIDALLSSERFIGARALLKPNHFRSALLTRAEPAAVGITSIGGLIHPISESDDEGLWLEFGAGKHSVFAPIAPGLYESVGVTNCQPLALGKTVHCQGPGVLAFDGERERTLLAGQKATMTIDRSGPRVLDVSAALGHAAQTGSFIR